MSSPGRTGTRSIALLGNSRQAIEQILTEHAELTSSKDSGVKAQLIFDRERHHYQLAYVGWQGDKRAFGPVMHFDIEDGKVWVQYNGTEDAVAERLVEMYPLPISCWVFIWLLSVSLLVMRLVKERMRSQSEAWGQKSRRRGLDKVD